MTIPGGTCTWSPSHTVLTEFTNLVVRIVLVYLLRGAESFLRSWLVLQLIKKFPAFYGTRKFITVLTSARHLSPSWADSIQSPQPLPTSWRSILILSSHLHLGLPSGKCVTLLFKNPCWLSDSQLVQFHLESPLSALLYLSHRHFQFMLFWLRIIFKPQIVQNRTKTVSETTNITHLDFRF